MYCMLPCSCLLYSTWLFFYILIRVGVLTPKQTPLIMTLITVWRTQTNDGRWIRCQLTWLRRHHLLHLNRQLRLMFSHAHSIAASNRFSVTVIRLLFHCIWLLSKLFFSNFTALNQHNIKSLPWVPRRIILTCISTAPPSSKTVTEKSPEVSVAQSLRSLKCHAMVSDRTNSSVGVQPDHHHSPACLQSPRSRPFTSPRALLN